MRLLFVTHKIHERDYEYAFAHQWAEEFARQGFEVTVVCLGKGEYRGNLNVISLGKEAGLSSMQSLLRFWRTILTVPHDRVFIHMNPKWTVAGAPLWILKRTPVYLWYTHYTMHLPLKVSHVLCNRLFAATKESMPMYEGDEKKIVTGHGVDTRFWSAEPIPHEQRKPRHELLAVHRICRSKRLDLVIRALAALPPEYTLTHYGPTYEADYQRELDDLIHSLGLENRVHFKGPVPMADLTTVYPNYRLMVNMAMATIDKTMVEGMLAGVHPIVARDNAMAIGLDSAPDDDTPEAIARHIIALEPYAADDLRRIAIEHHSLESLIKKMSAYIRPGT